MDWADTVDIQPSAPGRSPLITNAPDISYPCGRFSQCDFAEFMGRMDVCAITVLREGETLLHRVAPETRDCAGRVAAERYGIASVTKSLTSLLLGDLMRRAGTIDVETSAAAALAPAGIVCPRAETTIGDLLRMSSGMVWSESEQQTVRIEKKTDGSPAGPHSTLKDAVRDRLGPKCYRDGDGRAPFNYSGFDTQVLAIIAESLLAEGDTLASHLENTIWREIGSRRKAEWKADFAKHPAAYCCLYTSADDLARLGEWVLDKYQDDTAPMHSWVRASVTDTRLSTRKCSVRGMQQTFRYGYQWWVLSGDGNGFTGIGKGGQYLHIFPDQNVVVVQLSNMQRASDRKLCESMLVHQILADHFAK